MNRIAYHEKQLFPGVSQFDYIKLKNKCHVPPEGTSRAVNWILEESSTGIRSTESVVV